MRAPRAQCPICGRSVALMPTRRPGYGTIHDHKKDRRSLILCAGSMQHMALSEALVWQDVLPGTSEEHQPGSTLF